MRYVSWYKCLIVSLVFSHLGFWSGNLFLIAPFPDLCLLVPFHIKSALTGPVVLDKNVFEYYGNVHVYCPGMGAYEPLGSNVCLESLTFSPTAHFLANFSL